MHGDKVTPIHIHTHNRRYTHRITHTNNLFRSQNRVLMFCCEKHHHPRDFRGSLLPNMSYEQSWGSLQSRISFWKRYLALQKRLELFHFRLWPRRGNWKSWDASLVFFSLACSFLPCLVPPPLFPTLFLPLPRILSPYTFQIRGTWISPAMMVKPYFQVAQIWWAADSKVVVCLCIIVLVPASKDSR